MKAGSKSKLEVEFDVTKLLGGQETLAFNRLETYSASKGNAETNAANNRGVTNE